MNREYLLLIGSEDRPEFRPILTRLETLSDPEYRRFPTLGSAEKLIEGNARLTVLLESRPGEYPPRAVERFRARFGPAPIVLVAGTLCEGEGRTGRLPGGIVRYYHYEWETAFLPELVRFLNRQPGRLSLPATATEEDFWRERTLQAPMPPDSIRLEGAESASENLSRSAVIAADPGMRELLVGNTALHFGMTAGFGSAEEMLSLPPFAQLERIVIDITLPQTLDFLPAFKQIAACYPEAAYTIYTFAPQPEEIDALASAAKKVTVIAKPFAATEFCNTADS